MPTVTQNYGIKKPIDGEKYDLKVINENADKIDESIKEVDVRVSNIIAQSGTSSTEVVEARGSYTVLNDRLENIETTLGMKSILGVKWNRTSNPVITRIGGAVGMTAAIGVDGQVVINDFDNAPIYRDMKQVTDSLGNVFIRIPKFYIRKQVTSTFQTWEISPFKHDGFYLPWCFWDFVNNKELDYVDVGKYQASLDGTKLESKPLKYPLINTTIVNFRTYARNNGAGYGQFDIHVADVLQTLFLVEFATLNSQAVMPGFTNGKYDATRLAVLTETGVNRVVLANANADVFKVGQPISIGTSHGGNQIFYGRTITAINVVDASNKELVFDGDPVNITAGNMVYNTGWRSGWSSAVLAKSGTIIANDGFYPMMYRGIESLYGDVWKWVDGVNITANQAWVCENQDSYVSNLFTAPYKMLSYLNKNVNGYPSKMGIDFANPYANFPTEVLGGTTTFYSDYYYQNTGQYVALLGGVWYFGAGAGLFDWGLSGASSSTNISVGGRLLRKAS